MVHSAAVNVSLFWRELLSGEDVEGAVSLWVVRAKIYILCHILVVLRLSGQVKGRVQSHDR